MPLGGEITYRLLASFSFWLSSVFMLLEIILQLTPGVLEVSVAVFAGGLTVVDCPRNTKSLLSGGLTGGGPSVSAFFLSLAGTLGLLCALALEDLLGLGPLLLTR